MSKFKIFKVIVSAGAAVVGAIQIYGEYKYYRGKRDANEFNKMIIDAEYETIKVLMKELKKKEEAQA